MRHRRNYFTGAIPQSLLAIRTDCGIGRAFCVFRVALTSFALLSSSECWVGAKHVRESERRSASIAGDNRYVTLARAEARKKDDLIREKAILLQEVQRRVADSLQIIAGVLLQSAHRAQSEEARGHLRNAHHRVMSIAAVQRHLALSALRDVALHRNFIQLCESLGASMIHDPEWLSIVVARSMTVLSMPTFRRTWA